MEFAGRVAVVIGAAAGLGRELAERAAALGMKLVLADAESDALEQATEQLQAHGAEVLALVCDVRNATHVEELAEAAMIRFHAVHLLVVAGDVGAPGSLWEVTEHDWEAGPGADLRGAFHGVRMFMPLMLACGARDAGYRGHVILTASCAGLARAPGHGLDSVSAQGVLAIAETVRHDLEQAGAPVGVTLLCTGRHPHAGMAAQAFDGIRRGDFLVGAEPGTLAALADRIHGLDDGN